MENFDVKIIISYAENKNNIRYKHKASFKTLGNSFMSSCLIVLSILNIINIIQILTGWII